MANLESVIHRLQRALKNRVNQLALSITSGGVDNMETVVDIKRGKTDPLTK
jgi:hypothetical protein